MSLIHQPDLHIEQRETEGIIILDLKGKLVLGPADSALRQRLQELLESGHVNVILNLKHVTEIDTSALGTLIFCSKKFRDAGGKLVLLNLTPKHTGLSNTVKLNDAFEIYQDEITAVNSFFPERVTPHYDVLQFVEGLENERHLTELDAKGNDRDGQTGHESKEVPK